MLSRIGASRKAAAGQKTGSPVPAPPKPPQIFGKASGEPAAWWGPTRNGGRGWERCLCRSARRVAPIGVFSPQGSIHGGFGSGPPMALVHGEGLPGPPLLPALLAALALLGLLVYVGALCAACRRYAPHPQHWGCVLGLLLPPPPPRPCFSSGCPPRGGPAPKGDGLGVRLWPRRSPRG